MQVYSSDLIERHRGNVYHEGDIQQLQRNVKRFALIRPSSLAYARTYVRTHAHARARAHAHTHAHTHRALTASYHFYEKHDGTHESNGAVEPQVEILRISEIKRKGSANDVAQRTGNGIRVTS